MAASRDVIEFVTLLDNTDPREILRKFVSFAARYLRERLDMHAIAGPWSKTTYAFRLTHSTGLVDFNRMAQDFAKILAPHLTVRLPLPTNTASWPNKAFFVDGWVQNMLEDRHSQSVKTAIVDSLYTHGMQTLACYFAERSFQFQELCDMVDAVRRRQSRCDCKPKKIFISCWMCDPQYWSQRREKTKSCPF